MTQSTTASSSAAPKKKGLLGLSMAQWIIVSMIIGILVGWMFPEASRAEKGWAATDLNILATIFLRMIKSLIVPLLFSTLVVGIAGHGDDMKKVGRLAFRSILYFEIVTTLALVVGLLAVNIVKPSYFSGVLGVIAGTASIIAGASYLGESDDGDILSGATIGLGAVSVGAGIYGILDARRNRDRDWDRDRERRRRKYSLSVMPDVGIRQEKPQVGLLVHGRF